MADALSVTKPARWGLSAFTAVLLYLVQCGACRGLLPLFLAAALAHPELASPDPDLLYRPYKGEPERHASLQPILTRPINWKLIEQQYDQLIKFATALRLDTADAKSISRRFND